MALFHPEKSAFLALIATFGQYYTKPSLKSVADWVNWETRHTYSLLKPKGFSLVPNLVFNNALLDTYLTSVGVADFDKLNLVIDEVHLEKAIMVFDNKATGIHSSVYAQLINQLSAFQNSNHRDFLHFQIEIDGLFICAFKNGQLQIANQFEFKAKEDILYYIAATANAFGLNLEKDLITYSGYLRPKTELKKLLHQYIGNLRPVAIGSSINFDIAINPIHQVYYTDIFILPLCAL